MPDTPAVIETHYQVLGVEPDASDEDIRKAFRKLALEQHPDKWAHADEDARYAATERFKTISVAYKTLCDAADRGEYDTKLANGTIDGAGNPVHPPPPPPPPPGFAHFNAMREMHAGFHRAAHARAASHSEWMFRMMAEDAGMDAAAVAAAAEDEMRKPPPPPRMCSCGMHPLGSAGPLFGGGGFAPHGRSFPINDDDPRPMRPPISARSVRFSHPINTLAPPPPPPPRVHRGPPPPAAFFLMPPRPSPRPPPGFAFPGPPPPPARGPPPPLFDPIADEDLIAIARARHVERTRLSQSGFSTFVSRPGPSPPSDDMFNAFFGGGSRPPPPPPPSDDMFNAFFGPSPSVSHQSSGYNLFEAAQRTAPVVLPRQNSASSLYSLRQAPFLPSTQYMVSTSSGNRRSPPIAVAVAPSGAYPNAYSYC